MNRRQEHLNSTCITYFGFILLFQSHGYQFRRYFSKRSANMFMFHFRLGLVRQQRAEPHPAQPVHVTVTVRSRSPRRDRQLTPTQPSHPPPQRNLTPTPPAGPPPDWQPGNPELGVEQLDVSELLYSQETCKAAFKNRKPLLSLVADLVAGRVTTSASFLTLEVVERPVDGELQFVCSDNRRLWCLKQYQMHQDKIGGRPVRVNCRVMRYEQWRHAEKNALHFDGGGRTIQLRP